MTYKLINVELNFDVYLKLAERVLTANELRI